MAAKKNTAKKRTVAKAKPTNAGVVADANTPVGEGLGLQRNVSKRRIPMHASTQQDIPDEARDPDFKFRWCADYNKGKIERYLAAGWQFVKDSDGNNYTRPGEHQMVLMRLPMEFWEEDQLAKRQLVIDTNKRVKADNAPKGEESDDIEDQKVPEYLAKGQNLL